MMTYLALIAITNLCLGYLLGVTFPLRRGFDLPMPLHGQQQINAPDTRLPTTNRATPTNAHLPTVAPPDRAEVLLEETEPDNPSARSDRWTSPTTWDDFAQQLRTIKDRLRYARSADDMRLAQDVAAQLENCAQSWCSQLQACLDGTETATTSELLAQDGEAHLEMCLAQIETTLTNIAQLDWSQVTRTVLNELEREIESLEQSQRRVSSSAVSVI